MKKLIIALAATALTSIAAAGPLDSIQRVGTPTVGLAYDYTNANGNTALRGTQEAQLTVSQNTTIGTFDAAAIIRKTNAANVGSDVTQGFEIGYSKGAYVSNNLALKGRIGYGQINGIQKKAIGKLTGNTGNGDYLSATVEGSYILAEHVVGFVGYRHRHGLQSDVANQNRSYVGVELDLTRKLGLRTSFVHDRQNDRISNGVATHLTYQY